MPELWEQCNPKSKAILIQLYWEEHHCFPDWYLKEKQPVTMSPGVEQAHLEDVARFMEQSPSRSRGGE